MNTSRRQFIRLGAVSLGGGAILSSTGSQTVMAAEAWDTNEVIVSNDAGELTSLVIQETDLHIDFQWQEIENPDEDVEFTLGVRLRDTDDFETIASGTISLNGKATGSVSGSDVVSWTGTDGGDIDVLAEADNFDATDFAVDTPETTVRRTLEFQTAFEHTEASAVAVTTTDVVVSNTSSALSEHAVFDDFADATLTGRDTFDTRAYLYDPLTDSGDISDTRPEWSHQEESEGVVTSTNNALEIEWTSSSSPVPVAGFDTEFDPSDGGTWYHEVKQIESDSGSQTIHWDFIGTDPSARGNGPGYRVMTDVSTGELKLQNSENGTIIDATVSYPSGPWSVRVERDADGNWELFFNGTSVGTATDEWLPDNPAGVNYTVSHNLNRWAIHRIEIF